MAVFEVLLGGAAGLGMRVLWENHRDRKEQGKRDEAVRAALAREVRGLTQILSGNIGNLRGMLTLGEESPRSPIQVPLVPLSDAFEDLVRVNPPQALLLHLHTVADAAMQLRFVNRLADNYDSYKERAEPGAATVEVRGRLALEASEDLMVQLSTLLRELDRIPGG